MSISYDLAVASSNRVALLFDDFPKEAAAELLIEIRAITAELAAAVKAAEPSRTGQLRASTTSGVFADKNKITGRVAITGPSGSQIFAKAAALEYGSNRSISVKSYTAPRTAMFSKYGASSADVISAYTRTTNIAEHDFLRGPLGGAQGSVLDRLNAALGRASATAASAP